MSDDKIIPVRKPLREFLRDILKSDDVVTEQNICIGDVKLEIVVRQLQDYLSSDKLYERLEAAESILISHELIGTKLMDHKTWVKCKNDYLQEYKNKPKDITR